jgi:hypothetical protein
MQKQIFTDIWIFKNTKKNFLFYFSCYFVNITFILIEKELKSEETLKNAKHNLFVYSNLPGIQCPCIEKFMSN